MPLPDVDAALKGDRVRLRSDPRRWDRLHDQLWHSWLGNAAYKAVFENSIGANAVVFVHPTAADCCRNLN